MTVCFVRLILQLEGEDGQPVDEESDVQRALSVVGAAVAELAGDAEAGSARKRRLGGLVVGRGGCAVEEVEVVWA